MGSQQTVQLKKGLSSKLSPSSLDLYAGIYRGVPVQTFGRAGVQETEEDAGTEKTEEVLSRLTIRSFLKGGGVSRDHSSILSGDPLRNFGFSQYDTVFLHKISAII